VDVGGGLGALLCAVLSGYDHLSGILLDRPMIIRNARPCVEDADLKNRCELVAGDFLRNVPAGGDLYILKSIIQDWTDEQAVIILRNCRDAMKDGMNLLIIERVVPETIEEPADWIDTDLHLLVLTGGRERTREEHWQLLIRSGFRVNRLIPTGSPLSIIEAEAC
jgi:hypothetical protein